MQEIVINHKNPHNGNMDNNRENPHPIPTTSSTLDSPDNTQTSINRLNKRYSALVVIILLLGITMFGMMGYLLIKTNQLSEQLKTSKETADKSQVEIVSQMKVPTSAPTEEDSDIKLFLGEMDGQRVIYVESSGQYVNDNHPESANIVYKLNSYGRTPVNQEQVSNLKELNFPTLNGPGEHIGVIWLVETADKQKVYVSLRDYDAEINYIYEIQADSLSLKKIWSYDLDSKTYQNVRGVAYIQKPVDDKYLVFDLTSCHECEPEIVGFVVLNLQTSAEKYIHNSGFGFNVISIDTTAGNFTYKKMIEIKETCTDEESPFCFNGIDTRSKPEGETISETLP